MAEKETTRYPIMSLPLIQMAVEIKLFAPHILKIKEIKSVLRVLDLPIKSSAYKHLLFSYAYDIILMSGEEQIGKLKVEGVLYKVIESFPILQEEFRQ